MHKLKDIVTSVVIVGATICIMTYYVESSGCLRHHVTTEPIGNTLNIYNGDPVPGDPVLAHHDLIMYIWYTESRYGEDKSCYIEKKTGELGPFQIRPIFAEDCFRLTGKRVDRLNTVSCALATEAWLTHYSAKLPDWDSYPIEKQYHLYQYGYAGFKKKYGIK